MAEATKYDYIIAGSGLAGLSLLQHILLDESLNTKSILVVDKLKKFENDKTWCFWEKGEGVFEQIVSHEWQTLQFFAEGIANEFTLEAYRYKMIEAANFYDHVLSNASQFKNVTFKTEAVVNMTVKGNHSVLETDKAVYESDYIFNSTGIFNPKLSEKNTLLQHFMGWNIKTKTPVFNSNVGTLMDFRMDQKHGATFMYVLPTSETEALVEYTLFSPAVLEKESYKTAISNYISKSLKIDNFEIIRQEFGVIPMSTVKFERHIGQGKRIINVGTAGGYTKASTGYTFQFVQRHTAKIIQQLKLSQSPAISLSTREKVYNWYDKTLLDVLLQKKLAGVEIFSILFSKNKPEDILAFLGNDSHFFQRMKIRNTVPLPPFMASGIKQLLS